VRYLLEQDSSIRLKILAPPFFDRFSPFSTVLRICPNRNSSEKSRHRPFFAGREAVKNGEMRNVEQLGG
jgi:hypothetical protein